MVSPTPIEVRACIIEAHNDGYTQIEISERYDISQSTVSKLIKKFTRDRHLLPGKAKGNAPLIKKDEYDTVRDIVREKPDITLAGVQEQILIRLNKSVSITTAWKILDRLNLRRKKKSRYAEERDREDVKKKEKITLTR